MSEIQYAKKKLPFTFSLNFPEIYVDIRSMTYLKKVDQVLGQINQSSYILNLLKYVCVKKFHVAIFFVNKTSAQFKI